MYYTITTVTTVGYGDISANNDIERLIAIFLMICGVLFFSYSSGTITTIISESTKSQNLKQDQINILNNILKTYNLQSDLYYEIMKTITTDEDKNRHEIIQFVKNLPLAL
jgi:ribosomal protein S13